MQNPSTSSPIYPNPTHLTTKRHQALARLIDFPSHSEADITPETRLAALELFLEKFGDFMLEVAVLVFVFVPLDFWRGHVTSTQIETVVLVAGLSFTMGLILHWALYLLRQDQKGRTG